MQEKMKLSKLLPVLPDGVIDAVCELVPEPEDALLIRKGATHGVEELEEGSRTAVQYISTRDIDRDKEILDPKGAILDQFKVAPQVLWGHDYSKPPIGSDEWVRVSDDGRGIIAKTKYASTPRAEEIFTLKQEGHLRTQSVGFVPIEWDDPDSETWSKTVKKYAKRWGEPIEYFLDVLRIYIKWLLLEHSDVSVPSNVHALQLAVSKGLDVSEEMLRDLGVEAGQEADEQTPDETFEIDVPVEENQERRIFIPKLRIVPRQEPPEVRDRRIWREFVARQRGQV